MAVFNQIPGDNQYEEGLLPYIDYYFEDKSKYKPITDFDLIDDDGDFLMGESGGILMNMNFIFINTKAFSEVGDFYDKHKTYTFYQPGTAEYSIFWSSETIRRREGLTLNCKLLHSDVEEYFNENTSEKRKQQLLKPLHITGDHYNHLNYSRMLRDPNPQEKAQLLRIKSKKKKITAFPSFWDGDYWNFKIDELIANNGKHLCKAKARRKGYSYKRGGQAANTINLNTDVTIVLAAYDISYLTQKGATTYMLKTNLDWYENNTYWKRGYVKEDLREIHLGYKTSTGGNKIYGWNSAALSESLYNNASAIIGKDATEIDIEEAGKCPNLQEVLNVTESGTESGDENTGTLRVYGTGGAKDADWAAFSNTFYNPNANNMLALENIYDKDARFQVCGFFHPQVLNYSPFMDEHGNSLLIKAYYGDKVKKDNAKRNKTPHDYNIYCAQRANSPEEAFILGNTNLFSSPALTEHYQSLLGKHDKIKYRDGMIFETDKRVIFKTHAEMEGEGLTIHPYIENVPISNNDDPYGCVRMFYPPVKVNGVVPDNTYVVIIDPMGKDKDAKEITVKHSLVAIEVWALPNKYTTHPGDVLVCSYTGRPETLREGSNIARLLTMFYNGKCLPEIDRGSVVIDFIDAKAKQYLLPDPTKLISDNVSKVSYGINIGGRSKTGSKVDDALLEYKDLLYSVVGIDENGNQILVLHYIHDIAHLKELLKFKKGANFDRISCGILYPIAKRYYEFKKLQSKVNQPTKNTLLSQLGLYQ